LHKLKLLKTISFNELHAQTINKSARFIILLFFVVFFSEIPAFSQVEPSFTQFFVNPYHFNPSYAGIEGRPTLFLYYRQQWAGIEGAPATANLSFHTPLSLGLNFGLDVMHDNRGIVGTNSGLITIGYVVPFSRVTFLRFGISAGMGFRNFDLSDPTINTSDPALINMMDNNSYFDGNVGLSFQSGYFNVGASLPSIFQPDLNSLKTIETSYIAPLDKILFNASYRFYFADDALAFEPEALFRYYKNEPSQYEGAGILHIKNLIWVGGSYRQDYGISAFAGVKIKNFLSFGYSYGIGSASLPGIGSSSHEFLLTLFTGKPKKAKKKDKKLYLSFIDAEKYEPPKPEKKPVVVAKQEVKKEEEKPVVKDTIPVVVAAKPDTVSAQKISSGPRLQIVEKKFIPATDTASQVATQKETTPVFRQPVREETIKMGTSASELSVGSYIIIGSFNFRENAEKMTQTALSLGYPASLGYVSERGHWYVYVKQAESADELRPYLPQVRQNMNVEDAWILNIISGDGSGENKPAIIQDQITSQPDSTAEANKKAMEAIGIEEGVKHEIVQKGTNQFELLQGNYIIVGVFSSFENAEKYSDQLHKIGQNVKWGFNSQKNYWYVYNYYSRTADDIKSRLVQIRKVPQLKEAWLLTVQ
jgi:type IX secretion system PorP/SprF family membrane protein